jgi:hypothetical protein
MLWFAVVQCTADTIDCTRECYDYDETRCAGYLFIYCYLFINYALGRAPVVDHVCEQRVTTITTNIILGKRLIIK